MRQTVTGDQVTQARGGAKTDLADNVEAHCPAAHTTAQRGNTHKGDEVMQRTGLMGNDVRDISSQQAAPL